MRPLEQLLVADREQRAAQRREHRQLVVRPLDRGERGADRLDLLAIVERLAADQQVRDAARLERLDVRPRDVLAEADETPEQDADVLAPRPSTGARRRLRSVTFQPLSLTQPVDERADRVRAATSRSRSPDTLRVPYGSGTGSATTAGCAGDVAADAATSGT